jgi:DNA processing protein
MTDDEILDLLTLQLTPGIGPVRLAALIDHFGSAAAVLRAAQDAVADVDGVGPRTAQSLRDPAHRGRAAEELRRARGTDTRIVVRGTPQFPAALADIPGAPTLLFLRGELRPDDARAVGLVGTRHPNAYGRRMAQALAAGLARAGVCVVSGMARGIDGICHAAALDAGGRTVAVLAGGFDRLYPPEHRPLADRIVRAGALVTESVPSQESARGLFPARNRIISGLSRAVVIVQAGEGSGALITARHAAEQGRPTLAVPGPADEEQSAGCHRLLRDGATLCRGVEDVLEEMDGLLPRPQAASDAPVSPPPAPPRPALSDDESRVYALLDGAARSMDELAQATGLAVARLSGVLLGMQMKKAVRQLPGNRFERW